MIRCSFSVADVISYWPPTSLSVRDGKTRMYNIYPNVIMVMRHTERLDDFFPDWIMRCHNEYRAYDFNMVIFIKVHYFLKHFFFYFFYYFFLFYV
uniref:Uncharacterized protein n=1 Tax=Angiostrongylus cantonensis TaxID=6313 RepID=A0A0K0D3P4_ANGCA